MATTAIIIGEPGPSRIILTPPQALALLALLRDPEEVRQIVAYISAECECQARYSEPSIDETVQPTASPGSTPANTEQANTREARERRKANGGKTTATRSRRRQQAVTEISASLGEAPPPAMPSQTLTPSVEPGKIALPTPGPSPVSTPRRRQPKRPIEPAMMPAAPDPILTVATRADAARPVLIKDFVVPLPDGRETYVAVYSDGSVVHETTAAKLAS